MITRATSGRRLDGQRYRTGRRPRTSRPAFSALRGPPRVRPSLLELAMAQEPQVGRSRAFGFGTCSTRRGGSFGSSAAASTKQGRDGVLRPVRRLQTQVERAGHPWYPSRRSGAPSIKRRGAATPHPPSFQDFPACTLVSQAEQPQVCGSVWQVWQWLSTNKAITQWTRLLSEMKSSSPLAPLTRGFRRLRFPSRQTCTRS